MALRTALAAAALTLALAPAANAACVYPSSYPGDDGPKDKIAAWMAGGMVARSMPGELPVMGALVESNMTNYKSADSDAVGYFGMRKTIWNSGEYAGYPDNPPLQLEWFADQAEKVRSQKIAQGYADYGKDPAQYGEWVADVERPAEQYRYRYQLKLDEARNLIASGCYVPDDQVPPGTTPQPDPPEAGSQAEPGADATAPTVVVTARRRQRLVRQGGVRLRVECSEPCRLAASGRVRIGKATYRLARTLLDMSPGRPFAVRLAPNPKALAAIRTALAQRKAVTAAVEVRAHDARGNAAPVKRVIVSALR